MIYLKSFCSKVVTQDHGYQRKERVRGSLLMSYKRYSVAGVGSVFSVLGDTPPLNRGNGDRVAGDQVLGSWAEGYGVGKYRQSGRYSHLNKAEYKYPDPECSFIHFG